MLLAALLGIAIPLLFLYLVYTLDLYASGSFTVVLSCLVWGVLTFFLANRLNTMLVLGWVSIGVLLTVVAPMVEEILKSIILSYHVRQSYFTYFVDGAIYGFAVGIGFAVMETLFYLYNYGGDLGLSLMRSFSTSLMHGSAGALIGAALGRFRFASGIRQWIALPVGLAIAILLHGAFNQVLTQLPTVAVQMQAIGIGLAGVGATVGLLFLGLREERTWLRETLNLSVGVSQGESNVVQEFADLDALLAPIGQRFGTVKQAQVEAFLALQARLGLKQKAYDLSDASPLRNTLEAELDTLRREIDQRRRDVGVYCMAYVRSILPPEGDPLWASLERKLSQPADKPAVNIWGVLENKLDT